MKKDNYPWVPQPVLTAFGRMTSEVYSAEERLSGERLVSDDTMERFYRHPWFEQWALSRDGLTTAWQIWFNHATVAASIDHGALRGAVEEQRERVSQLSGLLAEAGHLLREIEAHDTAAKIDLPLACEDLLYLIDATVNDHEVVSGEDRARYALYSRPLLDEIFQASGSHAHFMPSVAQALASLGNLVGQLDTQLGNRKTIPWATHAARDTLVSQKANDLGAYIKHFDRQMWMHRSVFSRTEQTSSWRLPDSLLALQCSVVLDLPELDGFVDRVRKQRLKPEDY